MSGIDYSRWDHLEVSDSGSESDGDSDDDAWSSSNMSRASPVSSADATSSQNSDVSDPSVQALEAAARRDRAQLAKFVTRHPCPCKEAIVRWLSAATRSAEEWGTQAPLGTIAALLCWMAWEAEDVLSWFHYPSFRSLWQAPQHGQEEAERLQREVGEELYLRGGVSCMQLHYYMLNYAMCGEDFLRGVLKPRPVYGYVNQIEWAWDGIGDWLA
jgi:hypothetical protein